MGSRFGKTWANVVGGYRKVWGNVWENMGVTYFRVKRLSVIVLYSSTWDPLLQGGAPLGALG
jgi:hypothetical protein